MFLWYWGSPWLWGWTYQWAGYLRNSSLRTPGSTGYPDHAHFSSYKPNPELFRDVLVILLNSTANHTNGNQICFASDFVCFGPKRSKASPHFQIHEKSINWSWYFIKAILEDCNSHYAFDKLLNCRPLLLCCLCIEKEREYDLCACLFTAMFHKVIIEMIISYYIEGLHELHSVAMVWKRKPLLFKHLKSQFTFIVNSVISTLMWLQTSKQWFRWPSCSIQ